MTYFEAHNKAESQNDIFCGIVTDKGNFIINREVLSNAIYLEGCCGSWDDDCQVAFKFNGKLENFLILDIQTGDLIQI